MPHVDRARPGSFRRPLGDCPALESSDRGTNQAESHRAGLGWAGRLAQEDLREIRTGVGPPGGWGGTQGTEGQSRPPTLYFIPIRR